MSDSKKARWTRSAFRDLQVAHDYIRSRNPQAAREFAASVRRRIGQLVAHPELGVVHPDLEPKGRYRYVVEGNYLLIYRTAEDGYLVLLRVWDARRDPVALRVGESSR